MKPFNYKVLLVEDVEVAQKVAAMVLSDLGCHVDVARTGTQAVNQANLEHYDIVFMDLGLPDMDGFSTTEAIRKTKGHAHIPIIALTAHEGEHVEETCFDAGMDGFMVKPLTADNAILVFKKYLESALKT